MHGALSCSPLACFGSEVLLTVQDLGMFLFSCAFGRFLEM